MSIIAVTEQFQYDGRVDESGFSDTRVFRVEHDVATCPRVSYGAEKDGIKIPRIGDPFSMLGFYDLTTRVATKSVKPLDDKYLIHEVTVGYKVFAGPGSDPGNIEDEPPDPLKKPAEIRRDFVESNVPAAYEIKDNGDADLTSAVANSAGQPFPTPPEREVVDQVITITRNEADFSAEKMDEFQGALNTGDWFGRAANTCKMKISTQRMREYGKEFEQVTYQIEYRKDGWFAKILDEGYAEYNSSDEEHEVARDNDNMPLNEPILLGGDGLKKTASEDPFFLEFQLNRRADFDKLKLPRPE